MIKVSIIIPVYNVEKYLVKCLESLTNQSLQDIEFICINDGSTDNSLEILNRYAANDNRFTIISQENQGQGAARNKGIEIAQGEYIGFVDPDDWAEPLMFETLYNKAISLDLDIIECNYFDEFDDDRPKTKWQSKFATNQVFNRQNKKSYLFTQPLAVWNKLFKTELIKKHNIIFSNGKCGEDHCFSVQARLFAQKAFWLDDYLYNYFTRQSSSVNSTQNMTFFNMAYFIKDIKNLLIQEKAYNSVKKEFAKYASQFLSQHYNKIPPEKQEEFKNYIKTYLSDKEYKLFLTRLNSKNSFTENIFSIKNEYKKSQKIKVLTILGMKFRRAS